MAFIFTMHSQRRDLATTGTLPAISEDDGDIVIHPAGKPPNRAAAMRPPWARVQNGSPTSYFSMSSDASGSETDHEQEKRLADLRENVQIAKRGGWRRLALWAVVAVLCVIGLVVGLVVGLMHKNDSSSIDVPSPNSTTSTSTSSFPAGSYAITTYLNTVITNCTSNPSTWLCYPYATYADSQTLSAATFSWVIAPASPATTPATYTVSSTSNPFSLVFSSTPLTLMDGGQPTEYYSFVLTGMNKPVKPTTALTSSNIATTCYFNQTHLEARLYTKMAKTYPPTVSSDSSSSGQGAGWTAWPYAVTVQQAASGGPDVPQCFDSSGHGVGTFVPETGGECSCKYQNFGT